MKNLIIILTSISFIINTSSAQNLIVSYNLDGTLIDGSGNNNNLIQSGIGDDVSFLAGISLSSNDSAAYFKQEKGLESTLAIDNSTWNGAAMSIWIKDCVDSSALSSILQGAFWGASVFADQSGKVSVFFDANSSGALTSTESLSDGLWHHIVSQNNGSKTELFIDGVLNGSTSENLFKLSSANQNAKIYVGTNNLQNTRLAGIVDNIKIYDDTLSAVQITNLYNAKLASVDLSKNLLKLSPFPNPAVDKISIPSVPKNASKVIVSDLRGLRIYEHPITSDDYDISYLNSGTYFLTLANNEGIAIAYAKFVKL